MLFTEVNSSALQHAPLESTTYEWSAKNWPTHLKEYGATRPRDRSGPRFRGPVPPRGMS